MVTFIKWLEQESTTEKTQRLRVDGLAIEYITAGHVIGYPIARIPSLWPIRTTSSHLMFPGIEDKPAYHMEAQMFSTTKICVGWKGLDARAQDKHRLQRLGVSVCESLSLNGRSKHCRVFRFHTISGTHKVSGEPRYGLVSRFGDHSFQSMAFYQLGMCCHQVLSLSLGPLTVKFI